MTRKDQIGRDAWTDAALKAMAEDGLQGVAVEPLARTLNVTKGSFYWHFANRDALLAAAVERWEDKETKVLARAAAALSDPRERLVVLIERAHNERGLRLTRAFTVAAGNPLLGPSARRVTKMRLEFLAACFGELGAGLEDRKHAARTVYAAYLGLAELHVLGLGAQSKAEMRAYVDRVIAALVPSAGKSPSAR